MHVLGLRTNESALLFINPVNLAPVVHTGHDLGGVICYRLIMGNT